MAKQSHENYRMKVVFDSNYQYIQWTTFMGHNNKKLILGGNLIKVLLVIRNNIIV